MQSNNKVAVVTGGSGVLGREFCHALARQRYKITILGRDLATGEKLADEIKQNGGVALAMLSS